MKQLIICVINFWVAIIPCLAQQSATPQASGTRNLPVAYLPDNFTIHFISPEPIQYVDISSKDVEGNLPVKNILRIRRIANSKPGDIILTVIGERFMMQYRLLNLPEEGGLLPTATVVINPAETWPLEVPDIGLSEPEMRQLSYRLLSAKAGKKVTKAGANGIEASVNRISAIGEYLFLDISYHNKTNIAYDVDQLKFSVDDKKIAKATNAQSIPINPVYSFDNRASFTEDYRNVVVFRKFSIPGNKVLTIELNEKQMSGRVITMQLSYKHILKADALPVN